MGMYCFINEYDRIAKRKVVGNEYLNEEFQEALKCCPSLMIDSYLSVQYKGILRKRVVETHYNIYHETPAADGSPYQAKHQKSGSGKIEIVIAYLHGIINGYHSRN